MKLIWTFCLLVILEIALVGGMISPRLVYDTELIKAIGAYHRNPTNETKEKRDEESSRARRTMMSLDMIMGSVAVLNSVAIWRTGKKIIIKAQQGRCTIPTGALR